MTVMIFSYDTNLSNNNMHSYSNYLPILLVEWANSLYFPIITHAAPSFIPAELPAVTVPVPSGIKYGFSRVKLSI